MGDDEDFDIRPEGAAEAGESDSTARNQPTAGSDRDLALVRDQLTLSVRFLWDEFRPTLRGLSDDEYLWEPVAGCPTVRRQSDGTHRADHQFPIQGAASIGQRLCWAAQLTLVDTNQHFGDKSITWKDVATVPGTAAGGVTFLTDAVRAWIDALGTCAPSLLLEHSENLSPGAIDGQFPFIEVVTFHFRLLAQSFAHVSMTRDLYLREHPELVGVR